MNPDQFPTDQNRIIQQLERRIADLEARVGTAQGAPITRASSSFFIPNGSAPSPEGGAAFYVVGGQMRWASSSGSTYSLIPPTLPIGAAVVGPANLFTSSGSAPGSYSSSHSTDMARDINNLHTTLGALLMSLRGAPLIQT
ncbi:hypothetical protein [Streptosporangium minutum]|uniref:Uncharacterized protein n=1 Tax=Streptosporangium minutum TaxID=569862 RepID=A0A243RWC5_9ACTN|nr:hypothetical protein [Streptosporangium minutum]OUC99309.1 hypothetical protein CA984_03625 [Streptosporangium minutum]